MNGSSPASARGAAGARRGPVGGRLGPLEVRHVRPDPLAALRVPAEVGLAGAPGPTLGVRGRPVVEDPPVGRPGPAPLGGDQILLRAGLASGRLIDAVLVDAGVDPAAADGGAVVPQLGERRERPTGGHLVPVDLPQYRLRARLVVLTLDRVVPGEVEQGTVTGFGGARQLPPDQPAEVVEEPEFGPAVAGRLDRLLPPLQQPLGLGERALLLHMGRRRQEEHLGTALLGHDLAGLDLRRVLPERGALDQEQVPDDQPVQVGHSQPLRLAVRRTDGRVLPEQEVPGDLPVDHAQHLLVGAVVAGEPGQVVVAVVVLRRGRVAPVRLEQAHAVRARVAPEALLLRMPDRADPVREGGVLLVVRHRQVPREQVEQRRDVGRALDAGVPAQRQHAAARPAQVAEQQLDDRAGADVLDADAVLGPADGVDERGGPLPARVPGPGSADRQELLLRHAADRLDLLGGVAGEVPLEELVDAVRVLEGLVPVGVGVDAGAVRLVLLRAGGLPLHRRIVPGAVLLTAGVLPAVRCVGAGLGVEAGEQAVQVLGVTELLG